MFTTKYLKAKTGKSLQNFTGFFVSTHVIFIKMIKKLLFIIFILSLILRIWQLGSVPEAIDEDEMALGYYGYSLLTNGTDEYGNKFPIYFESIGDYKYGVYSYFATIPIAIFGLNPASARAVATVSGALTSVALYYLVYEAFKNKKHALLSAILIAISPTHIHFSRVGYNNTLGLFFAVLSILFFLYLINKKESKFALISFIFFLLSIYSYQAFRIFMPAMFVSIGLIYFINNNSKNLRLPLLLISTVLIVSGLSLIPKESRVRSQSLDILVDTANILEQSTEDATTGVPFILTRALHNKLVSGGLSFIGRYLEYFDPKFLFMSSSGGADRHSTPNVGLLYLIELPIFLIALYFLNTYSKSKYKFLPILWILISPLAAALVVGSPNTTRSVMSTVGFASLLPLGILQLIKVSKKKYRAWVIFFLICMYLGNFIFFWHQYWVHKRIHHPWYSDVGLREMVEFVSNKYYEDYENIVVSGGHYVPFLFYNKIHPDEFMKKAVLSSESEANWNRVEKLDKIVFNMPVSCPVAGKENVLYVCFGTKTPINGEIKEVIRYRDGLPAILLIEFIPLSNIAPDRKVPERVDISVDVSEYENNIIPKEAENFWPI